MVQAYNKSRSSPKETGILPKDVSLLPKSAKCAGRKAVICLKTPAAIATNHVKHLAITV
jgi:hypothetical protein